MLVDLIPLAEPAGAGGACPSCDAGDPTCACSLPDGDVMANLGDDADPDPPLEPADYTCLGDNPPPPAPGGDVSVTGEVRDFQSAAPLAGALVEAFPTSESFDVPCDESTADASGAYAVTLSADCLASGLVSWRVTLADQLDTIQLGHPLDCP